jgi:hypothetical protein
MHGKFSKFGLQLLAGLGCSLCLGLGVTSHHSGNAAERLSPVLEQSRIAAVPFAIADLDGDRIPDLALVETGSLRSAQTNYSIRLQFGAGPESAIGINAPFGGLRIAARDVNGDRSIDLIVTSNLDASFVEVLLNDGHGNFSVAAPGEYSGLANEFSVFLNSPAGPAVNSATLVSFRSSFGEEGVLGCAQHSVLSSDYSSLRIDLAAPRQAAYPPQGRAPPSFVALS